MSTFSYDDLVEAEAFFRVQAAERASRVDERRQGFLDALPAGILEPGALEPSTQAELHTLAEITAHSHVEPLSPAQAERLRARCDEIVASFEARA